jgi:hypothetical protein
MKSVFTLLFIIFATVVFSQNVDFEKLNAYFEKTAKEWEIPGMEFDVPNDDIFFDELKPVKVK